MTETSTQPLSQRTTAAAGTILPPVVAGISPLPELLSHFLKLWTIKLVVSVALAIDRFLHPPSASIQPTLVRAYPCRPMLRNRFFYPPNWEGGSKHKLPVYLDIHGGGFAFGQPDFDDEFCTSWAKRTGMLVVSLDYRKAPIHRFPTPVRDIAAVADAVLNDATLPIDHSRVVIGGFSAGGTLALSASQLPELKGRVKAAIPYYPAVDWTTHPSEKFRLRLATERSTDSLEKWGPCMSWGYIPYWQDRRDPVLSPMYANADDLPPWIMMVCAEHDILTREARVLITRLAGITELHGEEVRHFERGTYKWNLVDGVSHSFTHEQGRGPRGRERRLLKKEEVYAIAHKWLMEGPLA
ncbi:alpha/beta hydrolase fold protein [Hyaloscypha variabilis]|jgi:acetyl esterase/lipase